MLVPARAGAATVDAGGLRAQLGLNPWHLTFEDRRGREVLRELTGGSGPSGALGFHSPLGWAHATSATVVNAGRRRATLRVETNDPAGRFFNVRVSGRPIGGVIDVDAEVAGPGAALVDMVGVGFRARAGERYIGFGERSNGVNQRGGVVRNYVSEGPYQQAEYPFLTAFIPPPGYNTRRDATYYPVPWLLSTSGYGVLVRNNEESRFRLGTEQGDVWSVEVDARIAALPGLCRPAAARRAAADDGADRSPAAGRGAVLLRALVPGGHGRSGVDRDPARGRRAGVRRPDLHALPALRRPPGQRGRRSASGPRSTTATGWRSPPTSTR